MAAPIIGFCEHSQTSELGLGARCPTCLTGKAFLRQMLRNGDCLDFMVNLESIESPAERQTVQQFEKRLQREMAICENWQQRVKTVEISLTMVQILLSDPNGVAQLAEYLKAHLGVLLYSRGDGYILHQPAIHALSGVEFWSFAITHPAFTELAVGRSFPKPMRLTIGN